MRVVFLRSSTLLALIALVSAGVFAQSVAISEYPMISDDVWHIELVGTDGSRVNLESLKGKAILINLWGTWDGPYRQQVPEYIALKKKYSQLEIIGLNIGDGEGKTESSAAIRRFVRKMKINYSVARISNAGTKLFYGLSKMQVVPQAFLIDRQARLRGIFVGSGERVNTLMNASVEALLVDESKP